MSLNKDIGFYVDNVFGLTPQTVTAGGSNDNSAISGATIDRTGHLSAVAALVLSPSLAAGETCDVTLQPQHSSDGGSTWSDFGSATTLTLDENSGDQVLEADLNLTEADADIRVQATLNFSAGTTDDCDVAVVVTLGPDQQLPA